MIVYNNELFNKIKQNNKNLSDIIIAEMIKSGIEKIFRKDKALYYQDEKALNVYYVISGSLKKIKYRSDSSTLMLGKAEFNAWLGVPEILTDRCCLFDAVCGSEVKALEFNKIKFLKLIEDNSFLKYILFHVAGEYCNINSFLNDNSPLDKIVKFLKAKAFAFNAEKSNMTIDITQENLSEIVGFTRETVNKYLQILQENNIIKLSRGKIEIINTDKLVNMEKHFNV